jgi:hypothetical protein
MCGILGVSGEFGPDTVAEVVVDASGYYAAEVLNNKPSLVPKLDWTCVLFTDFKGVPPLSKLTSSGTPPYGWASNSSLKPISGSTGSACIWAGFSGNLENTTGTDNSELGFVAAPYQGPETSNGVGATKASSYAFCSGYSSPLWTGWKHSSMGLKWQGTPTLTSVPIPKNKASDWCYLQGIELSLVYPNYSVGPVTASLTLSSSGDYGKLAGALPPNPPGGVGISYDCLPLTQ